MPLARVVAEHRGKLPKFFKRYQIQPVWRADRPARGRFREFYQCDVDAIGSTSPVVEAEMIAAVSEVLQALGFTDFVVQLNHRELLTAMLDAAGVPPAQHGDALIAIDKLDKIGRDGVARTWSARGIDRDGRGRSVCGAFEDVAAFDAAGDGRSERGARRGAPNVARDHGAGRQRRRRRGTCSSTPRLARGLSYYTGAIMEIAVAGSRRQPRRRRPLRRPDRHVLAASRSRRAGSRSGLERILVVMTERGMFPAGRRSAPGPMCWSRFSTTA